MRFQSFTPLLALVPHALASFKVAFDGGAFNVLDEIADTAAAPKYKVSSVHMPSLPTKEKKREDVPDYLFVLFCTLAGFRGDCDVFGSPPGSCVSFFDYDTGANLSAIYNDNTESLSTNTGGMCNFYNGQYCDFYDNDTDITLSYAYDLDSTDPDGYKGVGPYNGDVGHKITSWRC